MMRTTHSLCLIVWCLILGTTLTVFTQGRSHDRIMKDVASTFAELKGNIDGKNGTNAAQNAQKLAALFKEVEAFWLPLRSNVALSAARDLQSFSQKVATAAANDLGQAESLYAMAGAQCKSCHDRHRAQMPDSTYRILP
jgi:cytochrome c556